MKVFIFGSTGFLGRHLTSELLRQGHEVYALARSKHKAAHLPKEATVVFGDALADSWREPFLEADAVVNLCGNNVARRWTSEVKRDIWQARVGVTRKIVSVLDAQRHKVLLNASAIGYYAYGGQQPLSEKAPFGRHFLGHIAREWEESANLAQDQGIRVVIPRLAVVVGRGGVLEQLTGSLQGKLGGRIGSGKQWFSWIHIADAMRAISESLSDDSYQGTYNFSSPNPVRQRELDDLLARAFGRSSFLKIPDFVVKTTLGEFSESLLQGQRIHPQRLLDQGFHFQFSTLQKAIENLR